MGEQTVHELVRQKQVEDSIKQEVEQGLADRAVRYLQAKPHAMLPDTHFSAVSAECILLLRDGHFYGCIALTQAVAEALARFLCQKKLLETCQRIRRKCREAFREGVYLR